MNCEKCKQRKATLFFSDEGGRRHALCAACGALLGKAVTPSTISQADTGARFVPAPTIVSLSRAGGVLTHAARTNAATICRGCGISADEIMVSGEIGCPECYSTFGGTLLPASPTPTSAYAARMPSRRRARLDREKNLNELRVKLRRAIDSEDFELAATLRDNIRALEKQ